MSLTASSSLLTVAENSLAAEIAIPAPSDTNFASSALVVTVTTLPSNGTVLLADGITPVTLGESLSVAQLTALKFRPTLDSFGTSSTFVFTVSDPASNTASATATLAIGPSNTPLVTTPAGSTENSTSVPENSAATVIAIPPPSDAPSSTPSTAAAMPNPASNGDSQGSYNSVFGKALDISVPSEAPSPVTFQVTGLPTNGTVVLPDGTTPVSMGQSLTPAQTAGLRTFPNGVAQNSQLDLDEVIPGQPVTHRSINIDQNGNAQGENDNSNGNQNTNGNANTVTTGPTAAPPITATTTATPLATATPSNPNPIVLENEKAGTPQSIWQVAPGDDSTTIQGFTTGISTPVGGTVQFKINNQTHNGSYQIQIYRLGYYGGNGATLVTTLNHSGSAIVQPNPIVNSTTGEVDAGNWSVTNSWAVPSSCHIRRLCCKRDRRLAGVPNPVRHHQPQFD